MAGKHRRYTAEEVEFLIASIKGRSYVEVASIFNDHFTPAITAKHVKSFCGSRKLKTGTTGQFQQGHRAWNLGLKGVTGTSSTRFKKGNRPQTWRPVGSERVNRDGLIEVKISEPRTWISKHRKIWEAAHGHLPKGHVVIFADRDPRNFNPDNLIAVSRKELVTLNKYRLIKPDTDLTKTGTKVVQLMLAISDRSKQARPLKDKSCK